MRKPILIATMAIVIGSGAAFAWFQWFAGSLGSPEEIQQKLLGEWYSYRQGEFGPMDATEYLEAFTFHDTSDRVKPATGSDDHIWDATVAAYIDNAPAFMSTATLVSRVSGAELRQTHTIGTVYEVYENQIAINMGSRGVRLMTLRELGPSQIVWVENDNTRTLVRKEVYDSASAEDLASIYNVTAPEVGGEE